MAETNPLYILRVACPDRVGLVAELARVMAEQGWFIASSRTFGDAETGRFFARLVIQPGTGSGEDRGAGREDATDIAALEAALGRLAKALEAETCSLHRQGTPVKTLILVSKSEHCANMLIHAARRGDIPIEPVALVSNHPELGPAFSHFGLPYHQVPVTPETRASAEARLFDLFDETGADLVVLARYMQVLSDDASERLTGRCINIHHSFLPSFKGARPYHQAHARGVKMIGATAHYVTADLDEGPIISQVTEPVDHTHSVDELIRIGRHLEATALMRAVRAHAEHRVFLNGRKTIVFH